MKKLFILAITGISLTSILMTGCGNSSKTVPPTAQNHLAASTSAIPSAAPALPTSTLAPSPQSQDLSETSSNALQNNIQLTVTNPLDGADINSGTVAVTGRTVPGATLNVNDTVAVADANGEFSVLINLEQGPNAIDVIANDDNGETSEVLIMVNMIVSGTSSVISPAAGSTFSPGLIPLTVTQPVDASTLTTSTVVVKGQTAPGATVIINDQTTVADVNGNFSLTVSLESGPNLIDVIAQDEDGNENEVTAMVNVSS
jgi:hypothetical protein